MSAMGCAGALVVVFCLGCGDSEPSVAQDLRATLEPTTDTSEDHPSQDADPTASEDTPAPKTRETVLAESQRFFEAGDFESAAAVLRSLLLQNPDDVDVLFRLANVAAASGDLSSAVELLNEIPSDHPQAGLASLGQSADWYVRLGRYQEAEDRYVQILEQIPDAVPALRQLARLLNRQGRRHEAATLIRRLCELGDVRQDELHALISLSDAMYDERADAGDVAEEEGYWPIGPGGRARKQFQDEAYAEAVEILQPSIADGSAPPALMALYGRAAVEAQDNDRFRWWLTRIDSRTREFSEYWAAIGAYLLSEARFDEAARALAEAIDRDPTDLRSLSRLRQVFLVQQNDEYAERLKDQWTRVRESLRANNVVAAKRSADPEEIDALVARLKDLDRQLEAVLWQALSQYIRGAPASERDQLNQIRQTLIAQNDLFPQRDERLSGIDLDDYPMPEIDVKSVDLAESVKSNRSNPTPAVFENVASSRGLEHTYFVSEEPIGFGFAIHQMLGGGVAVLDFDRNGFPDLYLAQGHGDPPGLKGVSPNQLMRQIDGQFVDATANAGTTEYSYTTGVASGDWNQDGFPDLVIRNISSDVLLLNQGDGTFIERVLFDSTDSNRVPSSTAIADLTGDGIPDIFHANYVDDPRRFMKPPVDDSGRPTEPILPSKFRAGSNEIIENDGMGMPGPTVRLPSDSGAEATSLGIVITDFDGSIGNEIFVANDLKPNRLWVLESSERWTNVAATTGCAFSFTGAATASMGVAAADLQNNGVIDLHITNYQNESASLYLGEAGLYQDKNLKLRIAEPSYSVLGFGTQAIDYDNDGRRDLVVTNGHIDDAVSNAGSFRQPAQLFANLQNQFQVIDVQDPSGYWSDDHLGRALACLDFDRNGWPDFVITHIEEPTALLVNRTIADHHWLQLELVGTESERDGIGARVDIRCRDQTFTARPHWK